MWTFAKEVDYAEEHCNHAKTEATPDALDKGYSAWVCTNWMGTHVYSVIEAKRKLNWFYGKLDDSVK